MFRSSNIVNAENGLAHLEFVKKETYPDAHVSIWYLNWNIIWRDCKVLNANWATQIVNATNGQIIYLARPSQFGGDIFILSMEWEMGMGNANFPCWLAFGVK